jgi:CBS domain containing-hemolysin-like protein
MSAWLWLLLLALLGSAFFSGAETAMVSSGRLRQRAERDSGRRLAALAERLYRRREQTLATMLLGVNVFNVLASVCALLITERTLGAWGLRLPDVWNDLASTLWITAVVLVFSETLPKSIARLYAERVTRFAAPPLLVLAALLRPPYWLLEQLGRLIRRLFGGGRGAGAGAVSWETVQMHLEAGRAQGVLAAEETVLIRRIGLLSRLTARSLMVPLSNLCLSPADETVAQLKKRLAEAPSRFCFLYEGGRANLVGLMPARRLLGMPAASRVGDLASPLRRVPAHRSLLDLLDELQFTRSKFAVVTDLKGRSLGAVFLADLLAELVRLRSLSASRSGES